MKPGKLIFLTIVFIVFCAGIAFAVGEDVTVAGDTKGETLTLDNASLPASGSNGEIRYDTDEDELKVWDGSEWKPFSANKNVATVIVAASNSLDRNRADYICDGTNNQVEINTAINDIVTNPSGFTEGAVYLLEGTYNLTDSVNMATGISLIGAGAGTVLEVTASTDFNVINASSISRILISQLMIDGNNGSVTGDNDGIYFSSVTSSKIDTVWIENMTFYGISFSSDSSNNTISNNNIQSNAVHGIFIMSSSNNTISNNNIQLNTWDGIKFGGSNNNIISNNNIQLNTWEGIKFGGSNNNTISGNNIQSNKQGINFSSSNNNTISNNNIQLNTWDGINFSGSNNNIISGNSVQGNAQEGIYVDESSGNNITGNNINDVGNNYDGIKIDGASGSTADNNIVSFNYIYDDADNTGNYGINITDSDCNNNYLVGNYINDNNGAGFEALINDDGDGTIYTGKEKLTLERASSQNPGSGNAITPGVASYIPLDPTTSSYTLNTTTAIDNGKSAGDILILENVNASNIITIPNNANTRLDGNRTLGPNDTLILIWTDDAFSGTPDPVWLELSYSNN